MKRTLCLLLSAIMALALVGCGGSSEPKEAANQPEEATTTAPVEPAEPAEQKTSGSEADLGDFHVKLLKAESGLEDYNGEPVIAISYEFTNNSDEPASAMMSVRLQAFQDGVELEDAHMLSGDEHDSMKDIKKGVTLTCTEYYKLAGKSDVEVECSELLSLDSDTITKTYSVK